MADCKRLPDVNLIHCKKNYNKNALRFWVTKSYFSFVFFLITFFFSYKMKTVKLSFLIKFFLSQHTFPIILFHRNKKISYQFSSNRPTGLIRSSSDVAMSVCLLFVCPLFMWYILRPVFPPLSEVGCPKMLEIQNPWGKVLERSGLKIEHLFWEVV